MSKRDMRDSGNLLDDILREVSPPVRWGVILGLLAGLVLGIDLLWGIGGDRESQRALGLGQILFIGGGCLFLGGFAGCVGGVLLEFVLNKLRGDGPKRR